MFNQNISDLKSAIRRKDFEYEWTEFFAFDSSVAESQRPHTDNCRMVDLDLEDFPDYMPCEWYVMDDEEYNNTIDANCDHVPFSGYMRDGDGNMLVVMLPHDYEEHLKYALYCQPAAKPGVSCPCGPGAQINWDEAEQKSLDFLPSIVDELCGIAGYFLGEYYLPEELLDGVECEKLVKCERGLIALMNVGNVDYFAVPYHYILTNQQSLLRLKEDRKLEDSPAL